MQGELDKKYQVGFYFSGKPRRANAIQGWPSSPEENMERLKDAGLPMDRGISKCGRCGGRLVWLIPILMKLMQVQSLVTLFVAARKRQWRMSTVSE